MVRCCVKKCNSDSTKCSVRFHAFPKNKDSFKKWIEKTNLFHKQDQITPYNYFKVCRKHFKLSDYISDKHLKKGSVPSLNLPIPTFLLDHDYCFDGSIVGTDEECYLNETSKEQPINSNLKNCSSSKSTDSPMKILNELSEEPNFVSQSVEEIGLGQGESTEDHNLIESLNQQFEPNMSLMTNEHSSDRNSDHNLSADGMAEENFELNRNQKPKRLYNSAARKQRYHASKVRSLKLQVKSFKSKENNPFWNNAKKKMGKAQAEFVEMQIRNPSKSKNGKRFNLKEKSMCLAMYKKGPKSYRSFAEVFSLPTKQTLTKHASCAHFQPGINENVMKFMKETVSKMTVKERMCCLSWDEVSLAPELDYSKSSDCIDGFVDIGLYRVKSFTNHALTFMVRGINKPFKQSVAYFLTKPGTKGHELAELIVSVIKAVLDTGLNVVLSVCDQIAINVTAINCLITSSLDKPSSGQLLQYTIQNSLITHIFDPCHLLKGIRNNLMTKNLTHFVSEDDTISEEKRTASWTDVKDFYKMYQKSSSQLLSNITDEHIYPKQLKMKVSVAAEIFSNTFGNTMKNYSYSSHTKRDFSGTADILIYFNDIFDSMNGAGDAIQNSIKGSISESSGHLSYWKNAIPEIEKMEWVIKEKDEEEKAKKEKTATKLAKNRKTRKQPQVGDICHRSKVLLNTVSTLKGLIFITEKLLVEGVESFSPRRVNSDGLENYFGIAKGVCQATKSPTPRQFKSAFSTIFFDNSSSLHSPGANCEKDGDVPLLESMELFFFLNETSVDKRTVLEKEIDDEAHSISEAFTNSFTNANPEDEAISYAAGRVCKKIKAKTKCGSCISTVEVGNATTLNEPSLLLISIIKNTVPKVEQVLPSVCIEKNLSNKIVEHIENDFAIGCDLHKKELTKVLCMTLSDLFIYAYVRRINAILKGKASEINEKDDVQKAALEIRKSKKYIGKYVPETD